MTGLAIGVASMTSGERALFHVGWDLAYGKEGNFSFPNVPPMADILYEAELIGFDETKEGKARGDMTVEERIGAADRRKTDGNALFKEDKLEEAMQQYEMAIAYMGDDFMFQLFGKYREMALAVKNPCHLNMAACMIKLKRYDEATGHCSLKMGGSSIEDIWEFFSPTSNGRTGNGKSATGNSILGTKAFNSRGSLSGVTGTCEQRSAVIEDGRVVNVIDTPGLFDAKVDPELLAKEIVKCVNMAKDGSMHFL